MGMGDPEREEAMPDEHESQQEPSADAPREASAEESTGDATEMASEAIESAEEALGVLRAEAAAGPVNLPDFGASSSGSQNADIHLLSDVNVNVKIELGRTRMLVEDVLKLSDGAVVELDKLAGDPVDIYVNERPIARGEVLVLNDNFCVRVNEILPNPYSGDTKGK